MRSTPRGAKVAALLAGTALIAAACGSSGGGGAANTTAAPGTTAAAPGTTAGAPGTTTGAAAGDAMTLTIHLNPKAVWDDGSPITSKDFECTMKANLGTAGSLTTVGYDQITKLDTSDPQTVVAHFKTKYAAYKNLFSGPGGGGILKADAVQNCDDISAEFQDNVPFSGRPFKIQSWSKDQLVLVPNDKYWDTSNAPIAKKVVMVPKADSDTELASLKSGEVGFIFPQAYSGISAALNDPNIKSTPGYGTNYEGLYFQALKGPFKDPVFRQGFSESIDRNLILKTIYEPIFPGGKLLQCGLWVPTIGKWCDNTQFENSYNPTDAAKVLTDAGWTKNGQGFWAKGGQVPTIRWMVNTGNKRRADTQALMIPQLAKAGFKVVADNGDAATVFQKRLPALNYDLAMYISTAPPDPTVTSIMACDQIPTPANGNQGQNNTGYCDQAATDLMHASDQELDETKRIDQIHQIGEYLVKDHVLVPLYQFPNIAAWRTDKIGGPVDADAANYRSAFNNLQKWQPVSGDTITIGAEQWPDCINPISECSNSSWEVWTAAFPVLPSVWDSTADGKYVTTALVTGEPEVATP